MNYERNLRSRLLNFDCVNTPKLLVKLHLHLERKNLLLPRHGNQLVDEQAQNLINATKAELLCSGKRTFFIIRSGAFQ